MKACLDAAEIAYDINPRIVRGLDYYTRTVFEFESDALGAQAVVCGGGRYDGLVEELGGPHLPSLGFGMGLERLLLIMKAKECAFPQPPVCRAVSRPHGRGGGQTLLRHRHPPAGRGRVGGMRHCRPGAQSPDEIRRQAGRPVLHGGGRQRACPPARPGSRT